MNLQNKLILEEYRKNRDAFVKLGDTVHEKLRELVKKAGINVLGIEHRVKTEASLAGKLERSDGWYQKLEDLTDLLGARIICFFSDEIDTIGKLVEQSFIIDRELSSDKRLMMKADTFGYLSLHYICTVSEELGYPPEVCGKKFEIQIRTNLQHTWAAINHDLGYKSEFGVPRVVVREFARLSGLLELADEEFVRVRNSMKEYTEEIRQKIVDNCADKVLIDLISLSEYIRRNRKMQEFIRELAEINHAEVSEVSPESYIEQLAWFGIKTLGGLQTMFEENHDLALRLAKSALDSTDLDIISSNIGLRYLCRAALLNGSFTEEQAADFLMLSTGNEARAKRQAKALFKSSEARQA